MSRIKNIFTWNLLFVFALIAIASVIFALRYKAAFSHPNFYAEDGSILIQNIFDKGFIEATLTGFNGYLIAGQYLIADAAVFIYKIFGLELYLLPTVVAILSCIFLGLTVSLPYILFKKQLGTILALTAVAIGAFVPVPTFDYAIIGTIGNLKFLFLYWAFLFILYRNLHSKNVKKVIISDIMIFLSIITYAPAVFLLPFALLPYKEDIKKIFHRKLKIKALFTTYTVSLLFISALSALYLLIVFLKGIPEIPGYLDTPYTWSSTIEIIYRVTFYIFTYPMSLGMTKLGVLIILGIYLWWAIFKVKGDKLPLVLGSWAIFIATVSFVANRPGISIYFQGFGGTPDQFFYAQTLVFGFMTIWLIAQSRAIKRNAVYTIPITVIFLLCTIHFGSTWGASSNGYAGLGTSYQNITHACKEAKKNDKKVTIQMYPTKHWVWSVDKKEACK